MSCIYTFKETFSDERVEALAPDLEKSIEGEIKDDMQGRIKLVEEAYGVKGVKMYIEYRNGDGSKIAGGTIE